MITWTNCAERMPTDDETEIIVKLSYVNSSNKYYPHGRIADYFTCKSKEFIAGYMFNDRYKQVQGKFWTPYTEEAWRALNK